MPSEYQKWIARDVKQEETRELTPAEKRANWWYYHKGHVAIGLVIAVLAAWLIGDIVSAKGRTPDCRIAYIGTYQLPSGAQAALETHLAPIVGDLDGNGKVILEIYQFQIDLTGEITPDPNQQMALMAHMADNGYHMFLLESPEPFQESFGLLTYGDGQYPSEAPDRQEPLWHRWGDCPKLTALPLGECSPDFNIGSATIPVQELMTDLYIARGYPRTLDEESAPLWNQIWQGLVQGN